MEQDRSGRTVINSLGMEQDRSGMTVINSLGIMQDRPGRTDSGDAFHVVLVLLADLPPLRQSLFPHVPPFLNYIPGPQGDKIFPPAIMKEQLGRVPQAISHTLALQVRRIK